MIASNRCASVLITVLVQIETMHPSLDAIETETKIEAKITAKITRSPMAFASTIAAIFMDDRNAGARAQVSVILLQQGTGAIESLRSAYSAAHTR